MLNINQITSDLARLPDQALQRYAMMHKDDPYIVSLALSESNRRKELRAGAQGQPQQQPPVVDQAVSEMAPQMQKLPEETGIGALPAQNIRHMAEGGIVGYADDNEQLVYNNEPALRMADGGMVAFADNRDQPVSVDMPSTDQPAVIAPEVGINALIAKRARDQLAEIERQYAPLPSKTQQELLAEKEKYVGASPFEDQLSKLSKMDELASLERADAKNMAMMKAAFAMMASRSPYAMVGLGEGAQSGLSSYEAAMKDLKRAEQDRQKMRMEIETAKFAAKSRDWDKTADSVEKYNKLQADFNNRMASSRAALEGRIATGEYGLAREDVEQEGLTARAGTPKVGPREALAARIAQLRNEGKNEEADRLEKAYRNLGGSTADVGLMNARRNDLLAQLKVPQAIVKDETGAYTKEQKAQAQEEINKIQQSLKELPLTYASAPTPSATPAPSARITPEEFDKRWATLKPGQSMTGPDGVTYTKK